MLHPVKQESRVSGTFAIGVLVLAGLVALTFRFAEVDQFVALARKARPAWLVGALGLQLLTYVCLAQGWRAVLANAGQPASQHAPVGPARR